MTPYTIAIPYRCFPDQETICNKLEKAVMTTMYLLLYKMKTRTNRSIKIPGITMKNLYCSQFPNTKTNHAKSH